MFLAAAEQLSSGTPRTVQRVAPSIALGAERAGEEKGDEIEMHRTRRL